MEQTLNCEVVAKNIPLRLTTNQMKDPKEALRNLYEESSLNEMREVLWDVFRRTFTANDEDFFSFPRRDMLYYYEQFVQILEAGSLLFGEWKQ
ncbi:MAG TPA: hypothetical protein VGS79_25140 [Puia sp.]|nr:hypothetical protein [Puia sp.]